MGRGLDQATNPKNTLLSMESFASLGIIVTSDPHLDALGTFSLWVRCLHLVLSQKIVLDVYLVMCFCSEVDGLFTYVRRIVERIGALLDFKMPSFLSIWYRLDFRASDIVLIYKYDSKDDKMAPLRSLWSLGA